jgi:hypothetical protein
MADFKKLKKPGRFGTIPSPEESDNNLEAPEIAPAAPEIPAEEQPTPAQKKSRGKTGRTVPFSTKVSSDFDRNFRRIAFENDLKKCELLEECLELYIKFHNIS